MAMIIVIPIVIVAITGLIGYLVYRFLIIDMASKRSVGRILQRYNIDKTPSQIIREYHALRGESLSDGQIRSMVRDYMRSDPDQFLAMYDKIRESPNDKKDV